MLKGTYINSSRSLQMPSKRVRDPRRIPTKWRIIQQIEGMTKAVTIHPLDADGKILPGLTISRISRKGELGDIQ